MKKGFTLIELLVVVLIIGILAAIAMPQYTNAVEKARLSEALSTIGSLQRGIDLYLLANGSPGDDENRVNMLNNPNITLDIDVTASMECSSSGSCKGKYFLYEASCDERCFMVVTRNVRNERYYTYELEINQETNGWNNNNCYSYSKIGDYICKSLQTQGWNIVLSDEL